MATATELINRATKSLRKTIAKSAQEQEKSEIQNIEKQSQRSRIDESKKYKEAPVAISRYIL